MHTKPNWLSERQTNIFNNFFNYYYYFFVAPTAARPEVAYLKVKKSCPFALYPSRPAAINRSPKEICLTLYSRWHSNFPVCLFCFFSYHTLITITNFYDDVKIKMTIISPIQTLSVVLVVIGKLLTSSEIKVPHHRQSEKWETKRMQTNRLLVLQTNSNCRIAARSYDISAVKISRARQSFAVNSLVSFVIESTTWNTATSTGWAHVYVFADFLRAYTSTGIIGVCVCLFVCFILVWVMEMDWLVVGSRVTLASYQMRNKLWNAEHCWLWSAAGECFSLKIFY